jgi:hypothetical protein
VKKLGAALAATIVLISVFLALLPQAPSVLAQYSWTDTINIYEEVNVVDTEIRKIVNNETVPVDVTVSLTSTEKINLLEYYKLSANGTNFIIISQGIVTLSQGNYHGLGEGQTLCFTIEAEGATSLSDNVLVNSVVEITTTEEAPVGGIWIPVNKLSLLAPYIGLASTIILAIAVTAVFVKYKKKR